MNDEDRFIQLAQRNRELDTLLKECKTSGLVAEKEKTTDEILEIVYRYLHEVVEPTLRRDRRPDGSVSVGDVAGTFFCRIIDRMPSRILEAETIDDIYAYCRKALTNIMYDVLRKRSRRRQTVTGYAEVFVPWTDDCEARFNALHETPLSDAFEILAEWKQSEDIDEQRMAIIIESYYCQNMTWSAIAAMLSMKSHEVERLRKKGESALRRKLK